MNRRSFMKAGAIAGTAIASTEWLRTRRVFGAPSPFQRIAFRELGSTGFRASEIGFGSMNMRDPELVHAAIDRGINYIDTAHAYMNGVNEEVVGKVMKTKRDKVFLATKVIPGSPADMLSMMETSLKRLQTDHVDLMQLHNIKKADPVTNENYIKAFDEAKKKGICRFVGLTTHMNQTEVLNAVLKSKFWEAVLVGYNCMTPPGVQESIEKTRKAGIAIIAMKNLLTSSWPPLPLNDIRKDKNAGITKIQAFLKWVLDDQFVDTTVPGMTAFEHIDEDIAVMGMRMSFGERRTLYRYGELLRGHYCAGVAGCTGCLNQCPKGVSMCELNRCIGYADGYGNIELARENYRDLPSTSKVTQCADCEECAVKCVNGLNLTHSIHHAKELFG